MRPNPYLKRLGLGDEACVVIFHADDIGMNHASLAAYQDLVTAGAISSAATMTPCAWYPATARFCRARQPALPHLDMGVHLTITSEWDAYRWGPVAPLGQESGLLDEEGYFYRDCPPVWEHANLGAVEDEIAAQYRRVESAGIDITHIDSHMACLFHPRFLAAYLRLAHDHRVPALLLREASDGGADQPFVGGDTVATMQDAVRQADAWGMPVLDSVEMMSLDQPDDRIVEATRRLLRLGPGIHYFIIHPSVDSAELRAIAPDWRCRVADYHLFMSLDWQQVVERAGIHVIGWRALRDAMRA